MAHPIDTLVHSPAQLCAKVYTHLNERWRCKFRNRADLQLGDKRDSDHRNEWPPLKRKK